MNNQNPGIADAFPGFVFYILYKDPVYKFLYRASDKKCGRRKKMPL